jgi:hypothetical protein
MVVEHGVVRRGTKATWPRTASCSVSRAGTRRSPRPGFGVGVGVHWLDNEAEQGAVVVVGVGWGLGCCLTRHADGGGVFHGEQQDGEVELSITEWTRTLLRDGCARVDGAHDVAAALMQRCGAVRRRGRRRGAGSTVWPCWPPARNTARRQARRRSSPAEGEQEARKGKEAAGAGKHGSGAMATAFIGDAARVRRRSGDPRRPCPQRNTRRQSRGRRYGRRRLGDGELRKGNDAFFCYR